jgi:hypothetical protein
MNFFICPPDRDKNFFENFGGCCEDTIMALTKLSMKRHFNNMTFFLKKYGKIFWKIKIPP